MISFDASTLILIAKAELLDIFLANVSVRVAMSRGSKRSWLRTAG
jgi:hypothetical protein